MTQPESSSRQKKTIRHRFNDLLRSDNLHLTILVPVLIGLALIYTGSRVLAGDWLLVAVSSLGIAIMIAVATIKPVQQRLLGRDFDTSHAFYLSVFWVYSLLAVGVIRLLLTVPSTGKESRPYYILLVLLIAVLWRLLLSLIALLPAGYRAFMSKIPLWEQILVAINEFLSASLLAFLLGEQLARLVQPEVFTLRIDIPYTAGLLFLAFTYYLVTQAMWIGRWNRWLSRNFVWVQLARVLAPLALVVASIVIVHHFSSLAEPRSATLLGNASIDQTILALSPIMWMMIFFIVFIVYSGGRGLRKRLLPDKLLEQLPPAVNARFSTISDMDILMLSGVLASVVPLQLFVFDNPIVIGAIQQQITRGNALIDSSEQALALIFALPFYLFAVALLSVYAYVMLNANLPAKDRDALVDRLPLSLTIMFIITLYLAAIPFSQVLSSGSLPQLPQDLGYILAFDVLIPVILLLFHYYLFIRLPYGFGQSRWRNLQGQILEKRLRDTDRRLAELQARIDVREQTWDKRNSSEKGYTEQIGMLHDLIALNGERDRLNMERIRIVSERQELAEVSETPVSVAIARLPRQVVSYGIPLVLAFKIYEWAIVNEGLREVANNPNIGVLEFFQTILENTNF